MILDNSQNNGMLVGEELLMRSLCESCVWKGCTSCPTRRSTATDKVEDYPQIIKGVNTGGVIKVFDCSLYQKKSEVRQNNTRSEFVYDSKTRKFIKKIK